MTLALDLCAGLGSTEQYDVRAVESTGAEGFSCGRQVEDRPPRRWRIQLPSEPHHRLFGYLRAFWREVKGPVVPFTIVDPDGNTVLVRFAEPTLTLSLSSAGQGSAGPLLEEAFGL